MDPRYTGRAPSPRRFTTPGRNSTGRLDMPDYESYYSQPRSSRDSIIAGPGRNIERVVIPRSDPRSHRESPVSRSSRDDYYVAPRQHDPNMQSTGRRPLSLITPVGNANRYRPVISSAIDNVPSPYSKTRHRDDESYYITPATSSAHHHRHYSSGGADSGQYSVRDRPGHGSYRSSGPHRGHSEYVTVVPQIREPRDTADKDYGYEYTNPREQVYRDTAPRTRTRRGSDLGPRDRPQSIASLEDYRRQPGAYKESGPPPSMRGFSKIEPDRTVRHEYRYPRDEDHSTRDRLRVPHGAVAVHQDAHDGYSSNVEERNREKHHRHHRTESIERESDRGYSSRHVDGDRSDEKSRRHRRTDSEDRHHRHRRTESEDQYPRSHRHRDISEDRYKSHDHSGHRHRRDDEDREKRHRDESRKDKYEDKKLGEGVALGAGAAAATGLLAESLRHKDRDTSDIEGDGQHKERSRRRRHRDSDLGVDKASFSEETDEDRRERRRRRRREREERERKQQENGTKDATAATLSVPNEQDSKPDGREERTLRRHGRHRRDRGSSSDTETDDEPQRGKDRSQVRVVSPPKDGVKKPKGILRPPTEKFPEDPAPIREGVAPLKDSGKKGIPPNARWTKIDRRLVNPEALEAGNERYEERPDYVIVLRVLSKEEIEKYAIVTQELRGRPTSTLKVLLTFHQARRLRAEQEREIGLLEAKYDSDREAPRQIAAYAHNGPESNLPIRNAPGRQDGYQPPSVSDVTGTDYDREHEQRPGLQKEASYQRQAPPNVQPPTSVPMYPPPPPASKPVPVSSYNSAASGAYAPPNGPAPPAPPPPPSLPPAQTQSPQPSATSEAHPNQG
jgi:hypothetical protein